MAESLGDVIINLRSRDVNMASGLRGISSGLNGVQEEVGRLSNKLFSAEGALHLAFGGSASRAMFHEMHGLLKEMGEGFIYAAKDGATFGESMDTAVAHLFKLKSAFEEAKEAAKGLADIQTGMSKGDDKTGEFLKSVGKTGDVVFGDRTLNLNEEMPLLSDKQKDKFNDAMKEYQDGIKKIRIGDQKLHDESPMKNVTGLADQSQYLTNLKEIQARQKEGKDTFGDGVFLASGGISNTKSGLQGEIDRVQKRVNNLTTAHDSLEDRSKELGQQGAFAEADNAKDKIVGMWDNLADGAKKAWGAVGKVVSDTAGAFKKDITKENEKAAKTKTEELDRKMRQEAQEAEEFFKRQDEQKKKNADEAKKFIEQSDPLAKLKDEFKEIDRLVGTGDLKSDQAKKAKDKEIKEFNAANRKDNKVEFRSADAAANDMLAKSLEGAGIQKEQRDLLQQLVDQGNKPKLAVFS